MSLTELTNTLKETAGKIGDPSQHSPAELQAFIAACDKAKAAYEGPADITLRITLGAYEQVALRLGLDLKLFTELVKAGELDVADLAQKAGADVRLVDRITRLLAAMGLVKEVGEGRYGANNITPIYAEGSPLAFPVLHITTATESAIKFPEYFQKTGWKNPDDAFSGPWQHAFNTNKHYFDWLETDPAQKMAFNAVMIGQRMQRGAHWFEYFPTQEKLGKGVDDQSALIVDVGGGEGADLAAFHLAFPNMKGRLVLQDLSWVVDGIKDLDRAIERTSHDFFKPQPVKGAKAYFLSTVLHDWPDKQAKQILTNIREAMDKDSLLLLHEMSIPNSNVPLYQAKMDFMMMSMFASGERSYKQWEELLDSTGFRLVKVYEPEVKLQGSGALFEAVLKD